MSFMEAKGWLRPEERRALRNLATLVVPPDGLIVNIGVEYGASVHCLHDGNPDAVIVAMDIDNSKYEGERYEQVVFWTGDSGGVLQRIWRKNFYGKPIDLLFIDGDHTYEGVKRDLGWLRYVKLGGYVLFHDCYDFSDPGLVHRVVPGVNEAVSEWYGAAGVWVSQSMDSLFGEWKEEESVGTMRIFRRLKL